MAGIKEEVPRYRKFNEQGQYVLDEEYIFAYAHSDGFTARLLNVDLLIDQNFQAILYHRCFSLGNKKVRQEKGYVFKKVFYPMPVLLQSFIEELMECDTIALNDHYGSLPIDNAPGQTYHFNVIGNTKTISVAYMDPDKCVHADSKIERDFATLHFFLREWTESVFRDYIQEDAD